MYLKYLLILICFKLFQSEITIKDINSLWNKIGEKWEPWVELWHGLGICNNKESYINEINSNICIKRQCLLSWSISSLVDLNKLILNNNNNNDNDYKYSGSLLDCSLPSGGQTIKKKRKINNNDNIGNNNNNNDNDNNEVEVSFIMTLGDNDHQASLSILELYRTAHEVESGEFIFIKKLGSPDLPITYRLIENLQKLFNADITLLVQSAIANDIRLNSNEAMLHSKGKYIALLDDSIIVTPSWISLLLTTLKSPPFPINIGIIGPLIITPDTKIYEAGRILYNDLNYTTGEGSESNKLTNYQARIVDFLNSKCILFEKKIFINENNKFHLFNSKYYTQYGRDLNLALELYQRGYISFLQPLSVVVIDPDSTKLTRSLSLSSSITTTITSSLLSLPLLSSPYEIQLENDKYNIQQQYSQVFQLCPYRSTTSCKQNISTITMHNLYSFYKQSNRILILDLIPPEIDKDAGSIRLNELFKIFHQLGYQITFQPTSTGRHVKYALQLLYNGIEYLYPNTLKQLSKYIQKYSAHTQLDMCPWKVIIACRRSVLDKQINHIKRLCPNVPVIFDTVDVHFIREKRAYDLEVQKQEQLQLQLQQTQSLQVKQQLQQIISSKNLKKELILLNENTIREVILMKVSNITYVVSSTEYETLNNLLPSLDLRIVSNIYNPPDKLPESNTTNDRSGALFVGNLCHPPNVDALYFIINEILSNYTYPNDFYFNIVISRSSECPQSDILNKLRNHSLIKLYFDVTNEFLYKLHMQVKIVLAPVLYGAGVKGKINYALLNGVPVISTSVGAEGMYLISNKSFLLANTGKEFYHQIMKLYDNIILWNTLRKNGLEVMKNYFSREVAKKIILDSFNKLKITPNENRLLWKCPIELSSKCSSLIYSNQLTLSVSSIDGKVLTEAPTNDKQEYFRLDMRYPMIREWRIEIMKMLNLTLPY